MGRLMVLSQEWEMCHEHIGYKSEFGSFLAFRLLPWDDAEDPHRRQLHWF